MSSLALRIPAQEMQNVLVEVFSKHGFAAAQASTLAKVHTESTLVGVNSHGINRVPLFLDHVAQGHVYVNVEAQRVEGFGNLERWDGQFGSGVLNATACTERAVALAKQHGMGLVALRNTNHWMRGGTYGAQAAAAGCISICFTNTQPNMPPWGGRDSRIGNNPFVVSIPRGEGDVVLDMALSQFAFGKVDEYRRRGESLPFVGGWGKDDQLTTDPEQILANERGVPIGYWKGSALSMVLDMLATLLSAGNSTYRIGKGDVETGISQVFLCICPEVFGDQALQHRLLNEIIQYVHDAPPLSADAKTYYPGERSARTRQENLRAGIPVDEEIWATVQVLAERG